MVGSTGLHLTEDTSRVILSTERTGIHPVLTSPREQRIGNPTRVGERMGTPLSPSVLFCRISLTHYLRGVAQFGRALAFGKRVAEGSILSPRLLIHNGKMHFYSVEYWQENWETLIDRVENGETIGIENENGERAVMVPADDELIRMYTKTSITKHLEGLSPNG